MIIIIICVIPVFALFFVITFEIVPWTALVIAHLFLFLHSSLFIVFFPPLVIAFILAFETAFCVVLFLAISISCSLFLFLSFVVVVVLVLAVIFAHMPSPPPPLGQ